MAYADQKQNRTVAIGSVALVHAGLAVALVSGLAVKFAPVVPKEPTRIFDVPVEIPPEPTPPPEPRDEVLPREAVTPPINVPIPEVRTPVTSTITTTTEIFPPALPTLPVRIEPAPPIPAPSVPPAADLSRTLQPRGNQGDWFPRDSYPSAARRAGAEGRVSVSVDVAANGRVTGCRVAVSSGNDELDAATCRLATRNGRFTPALDAAGRPVPGTLTLRPVRWTLEE